MHEASTFSVDVERRPTRKFHESKQYIKYCSKWNMQFVSSEV